MKFLAIPVLAFAIFSLNNSSQISNPSAYNGPFQGNPNPSISSITPSIACSRSGTIQTPAFIQCSASPTTYSASNGSAGGAYEDLEYTWNFGDPNGTETFTHPISGNSVNANTKQWGPEATYVYRSAGTYTVTLNVRGCTNGPTVTPGVGSCSGGTYTTSSATTTVSVSTFNASGGTFYYDTGGSGTTCSIGSPCAITQFPSKLANNTQHFFQCGQAFTGTGSNAVIDFGGGNLSSVRLGAGGSSCPGAVPSISVTSGTGVNAFFLQGGGSAGRTKSDIVISNISFTDGGSASLNTATCYINAGGGPGVVTDVYLDFQAGGGCAETLNATGGPLNIQPSTVNFFNIAIWGGTFTTPLASGGDCIGILGGAQQWYSIVGASVSGNGGHSNVTCHHIYMHTQYHQLARWNVGGASCSGASCTPTRNYAIKTSFDCANGGNASGVGDDCVPGYSCSPPGVVCIAQYALISENLLTGTLAGRNISTNNNNPADTRYTQYVDQQNQFTVLPNDGAGTGIFQPWTAQTLTVRDERVCNPNDQWFTPNGIGNTTYLNVSLYRNYYFQNTVPGANGRGAVMYGQANVITWGGGSPLTQVVTDNIFEDDGSTSSIVIDYIKSSDWVTAGSVIDRNQYYAPNAGANNFLSNNGTGVSFATWKGLGWDTNGSTGSNPSWPAPATCNFGTWPFN